MDIWVSPVSYPRAAGFGVTGALNGVLGHITWTVPILGHTHLKRILLSKHLVHADLQQRHRISAHLVHVSDVRDLRQEVFGDLAIKVLFQTTFEFNKVCIPKKTYNLLT